MASVLKVDKLDPQSGTALEIGTSGDTITVPSGATFVVAGTTEITGTNNVQRPNAQPLIINGDMAIAQRSTSVTAVTTEGYKTCDRFKLNGTVSGAELTIIQEALSSGNAYDDGFRTAWRADCTTATAPASGERLELQYKMEAQDCQLFKSGTSNAQKFTLSFWVKSSYTGATTVNLFNGDASSRMIGATYTISVADTWEKKVLNYAADTTSGFNNDNGIGLYIVFGLAGGSNYTSGSTPSAWQTYSDADVYPGGTPALSSNTANDWAVTGVQLEVGEYTSSTIAPFQHENYGDNLFRCERYFTRIGAAQYGYYSNGAIVSATAAYGYIQNPVSKRTAPTWSHSGASGFQIFTKAAAAFDVTVLNFSYVYNTGAAAVITVASGLTDGCAYALHDKGTVTTYLYIDAEL